MKLLCVGGANHGKWVEVKDKLATDAQGSEHVVPDESFKLLPPPRELLIANGGANPAAGKFEPPVLTRYEVAKIDRHDQAGRISALAFILTCVPPNEAIQLLGNYFAEMCLNAYLDGRFDESMHESILGSD